MVSAPRLRLLLVVAGCLALAGALVPSGAATATATAVGHPAQSSSSINDTASTRRVQLMAGGLAVLGIGLIGITVWFWRSTRPDPEALAPLEMMGRRRWRRLDVIDQRHRLDDVRAHVNDEEAEAARQTFAPDPVAPPPPPPAVVVEPAAVLAEAEPADSVAVPSPPAHDDASGDAVSGTDVSVVEGSGIPGPTVEASDGSASDDAPASGDAEVSGEHARVHGDPLVRAMEKDTGPA